MKAGEFKSVFRYFTGGNGLYNLRISVHSLNSRELKDGTDVIYATITIQGLEHLNAVISKLSNIEGIISIKRS